VGGKSAGSILNARLTGAACEPPYLRTVTQTPMALHGGAGGPGVVQCLPVDDLAHWAEQAPARWALMVGLLVAQHSSTHLNQSDQMAAPAIGSRQTYPRKTSQFVVARGARKQCHDRRGRGVQAQRCTQVGVGAATTGATAAELSEEGGPDGAEGRAGRRWSCHHWCCCS